MYLPLLSEDGESQVDACGSPLRGVAPEVDRPEAVVELQRVRSAERLCGEYAFPILKFGSSCSAEFRDGFGGMDERGAFPL